MFEKKIMCVQTKTDKQNENVDWETEKKIERTDSTSIPNVETPDKFGVYRLLLSRMHTKGTNTDI